MCQIRFGLLFAALAGSLFLAGCGGSDPARPSAVASQCALPLKHADGLSVQHQLCGPSGPQTVHRLCDGASSRGQREPVH